MGVVFGSVRYARRGFHHPSPQKGKEKGKGGES